MALWWLSKEHWSFFVNYSFKEAFFLSSGLAFGPILHCCLASPSVPWSEGDSVFCWETAEVFPPLQTVFPLCAFWLEEMKQQKRRWQQLFKGFPYALTYHSYLLFHLSSDTLWQTCKWLESVLLLWSLLHFTCFSHKGGHVDNSNWYGVLKA